MFNKILANIRESLNQFSLFIKAVFGGLIIISSIVLSIVYIPLRPFAILTASLGCCIGMAIFYKAYLNLTNSSSKKQLKDQHDLSILEEKFINSENSRLKIQLEKERLERTRIDITTISPILKLGLITVNVNLHDFMRKVLRNETVEEGLLIIDKVKYYDEYIGLVNKKFDARLGIDLRDLKIFINNDRILVAGVQSEFQGRLNDESNWLLHEIRHKRTVNGKLDSHQIRVNDNRIQASMIEQENSFNQRLNLGLEFKNLDAIIHEMAKQFICIILSPLKKEITFVDCLDAGLSLVDFINDQNQKLTSRINALENPNIASMIEQHPDSKPDSIKNDK